MDSLGPLEGPAEGTLEKAIMDVQFTVHSVNQGPTRVPVTFKGQDTTAVVDCVEVELTPVNPEHGTLTLRFVADDRAPAADLFTPDKTVTLSIS